MLVTGGTAEGARGAEATTQPRHERTDGLDGRVLYVELWRRRMKRCDSSVYR